MTSNPVRILSANDPATVCEGIKMFLMEDKSLQGLGKASNGKEALEQLVRLRPDVVLMDLVMPMTNGFTAIQQLKQTYHDPEVIALTRVLEDDKVVGAVQAGRDLCRRPGECVDWGAGRFA